MFSLCGSIPTSFGFGLFVFLSFVGLGNPLCFCVWLAQVVASGSSDPVLALESKSLAYTGDVLELKSYKSGNTDFNFITATDGDSVLAFEVDGEGSVAYFHSNSNSNACLK